MSAPACSTILLNFHILHPCLNKFSCLFNAALNSFYTYDTIHLSNRLEGYSMTKSKFLKRINALLSRKNLMLVLLVITALFFTGVLWINFFGRKWYCMDMYTDAYLATLMATQHTIFPDGWIFGNQYYGFATPVLAAVIYLIFPNSFYAMAIASTIMTALIFCTFIWCTVRYCSKSGISVGLFAIFCLILGNHAATYPQGMQLFYTMASYYACYLIGILLTLGLYLRLVFSCSPPANSKNLLT